MKVIEQSWDWLQKPVNPLQTIEKAGRTCYKSEDRITDDSAERFVKMIVSRGHETVIEHVSASIRLITNRGVSHELVRHRLSSFSQESTRYVRYDGNMEFIIPVWCALEEQDLEYLTRANTMSLDAGTRLFLSGCIDAEGTYTNLISAGWRPEQAREVLPNSLKTEIVMSANLREWRHVFNLRCSKAAHPQIRALMLDCLQGFYNEMPVVFEDLYKKYILKGEFDECQ